MKRCMFLLLLSVILIPMIFSNALAAEKIVMKLAYGRPEGTAVDKSIKWFVEKVKQDSGGRIVFELYPNFVLGDYTTVQERVSIGDVEMQLSALSPAVDRRVGLHAFPYLAKNWDEAKKLFRFEGVASQKLGEMLLEQDIQMLCAWPAYFGQIALTKEPKEPGNPNVDKGIKIRVPPIKSFELVAKAFGFMATPIPYADTFTALQTGIVDGVIGSGPEGYISTFQELVKYLYLVNDHFEVWYLIVNAPFFNRLSEEDQAIIFNAAQEMEKMRWEVAEEDEKKDIETLASRGVKIIALNEEELSRFKDKVIREVWPHLYNEVPKNIIDECQQFLSN